VGVDDRGPREPGPDEHAPSVVRGEGPPEDGREREEADRQREVRLGGVEGTRAPQRPGEVVREDGDPDDHDARHEGGVGQPPEPEPRGEPGHADRDGDQLERRQPLGWILDARPDGDELRHRADNRETHPPPRGAGARLRSRRGRDPFPPAPQRGGARGSASDEKRQRDEEVAKRDRGRRARRGRDHRERLACVRVDPERPCGCVRTCSGVVFDCRSSIPSTVTPEHVRNKLRGGGTRSTRMELETAALERTDAPADRPVETLDDVRDLGPPEPLRQTLELLADLPDETVLVQRNDRAPQFLYPKLDDRGYAHETIGPTERSSRRSHGDRATTTGVARRDGRRRDGRGGRPMSFLGGSEPPVRSGRRLRPRAHPRARRLPRGPRRAWWARPRRAPPDRGGRLRRVRRVRRHVRLQPRATQPRPATHGRAGFRYAEEADDPTTLRAEFTPTTAFCPQAEPLAVGVPRARRGRHPRLRAGPRPRRRLARRERRRQRAPREGSPEGDPEPVGDRGGSPSDPSTPF